jgi:hypothetical protein
MSYAWNKETISVSEIVSILYEQYNQNPTISIPITDGDREFNYRKDFIPVRCSRCGNSYQITPFLLLSMKDDRGYSCSQCGKLSDNELRNHMQIDMLKRGREQIIEMGINPDEEDEDEKEQREQEESEQSIADIMKDEAKEMFMGNDNVSPDSQINADFLIPTKSKESLNADQNNNSTFESTTLEEEDSFTRFFNETDIEQSDDMVEVIETGNDETPIELIGDSFLDDRDPEEMLIDEEEPFLFDSIDDMPIIDDSDENIMVNETPSYEINDVISSITKSLGEQANELKGETIEEYIEINGKKWKEDALREYYKKIILKVKEAISFNPFGDFNYENGILSISCKVCGNSFNINDIDALVYEMLKLDKETCSKYGIKFKGEITISSCPHCKASILKNGYNEFYRKKIETVIKRSNLKIVNPENYWYATPNELYLLEANGVSQYINYIDLCNKYSEVDMSKHSLFIQRGNETKNEATSVNNSEKDINNGVFTVPKHAPKSQYDFTTKDNSPEFIFERHQKQADSQMVFRKNDQIKKQQENIAVLNGKENPFERKEKLNAAFMKTPFFDFIQELAQECNVGVKFEISQKTFEIPIVDFEPYAKGMPGFRLICADYAYNSMCDVPFNVIANSIPYLFGNKVMKTDKKYSYSVLYSDSLQFREQATFNALVKHINPMVLKYGGKRIQLEGNLLVQYTDYDKYLNDFTKECSPFPDGKPNNGKLGILASWVSNEAVDAKDILEALSSLDSKGRNEHDLDKLKSDYGMYMACAISYIEQYNKDSGKMTYIITEYIEKEGAIYADGLYQCVKALLKEYYLKYPHLRERSPYIMIEIDPNSYTSPSIKYYINRKSLLPVDKVYRMQFESKNLSNFYMTNSVKKHLKYCYVKKENYRNKNNDRDYMRHDIRKFNAKSLISTMPEEIKIAGLQSGIFNDAQRQLFIMHMGFVYATQLEIKEYFLHQGIIQRIMLDGNTLLMPKAVNPDSIYNGSGIVNSSGNDVQTINSAMFNPHFRAKMDRIVSGNITPEANDFYRNYMAQKQQAAMQEIWNQQMNRQREYAGTWQENPKQPMTNGAYIMPNMQGMNFTP